MDAFRRVRGGVASHLDVHERILLARPFTDVAALLGHSEPLGSEDAADGPGAGSAGAPAGAGETDHTADDTARGDDEAAILAALDFVPTDAGPGGDRPPSDPALARLLPDMSEDAAMAGELRELTEPGLRAEKIGRLLDLVDELETPTGPGGSFFVPDGREADVLRAVNDVRIVLATRLGVGDGMDDDELYERARSAASADPDHPGAIIDAMAILYTSLTWWQESLINALHTRRRPN